MFVNKAEHRKKKIIFLIAAVLLTIISSQDCVRDDLLALNQIYEVAVGGEHVISLKGRSLAGKKTLATVTSLPSSGSLHQLSYVFDKYGYEPKAGPKISAAPCNVTSRDGRVLYRRPDPDRVSNGRWDVFTYKVSDGFKTSLTGKILLVPPSHVITKSTFISGVEEWRTVGNNEQRGNKVTHEQSSRGNMSYFIYASDDLVNVDHEGNDLDLWSFLAPPTVLGWMLMAYGGSLEFTMAPFSGDFSPENLNFGGNLRLVEMVCSTCNYNRGVTIGFPLNSQELFKHGITKFNIPLLESAGWVKDPKNVLLPWSQVSKCEFLEIISNISRLKILGDFTKWYETVSIDDFQFRSAIPQQERNLPKCAQWSSDASDCRCAG